MEFNALLNILDASDLTRESIDLNGVDKTAVSYGNYTDDSLTATVNGTSYSDLIRICLVENNTSVKVYINDSARFKLNSIDLGSVSTFSIS